MNVFPRLMMAVFSLHLLDLEKQIVFDQRNSELSAKEDALRIPPDN